MPCSPTAPTSSRATGTRALGAPSSETPSGTRDLTRSARPSPPSIDYVEGTESQTAVQQVINDDEAHRQSVTLDSAPPAMQQHVLSDAALKSPVGQPVGAVRRLPRAQREQGRDAQRQGPHGLRARHQPRGLRHRARAARAPPSAAYSLHRSGAARAQRRRPGRLRRLGRRRRGPGRAAGVGSDPAGEDPRRLPLHADGRQGDGRPGQRLGGRRLRRARSSRSPRTTSPRSSAPDRTDQTDVFWANWAPAWPSASTVLPPLFDSRINLHRRAATAATIGGFPDERVNGEITRIGALPDLDQPGRARWSALDASLAERGVFIALAQRRALYVAGSSVTGPGGQRGTGRVRRPRHRGCEIAP